MEALVMVLGTAVVGYAFLFWSALFSFGALRLKWALEET